ncbi:MAG: 30S ribosomal protein S9 [bacterium]|nr:30S ribosomal protein S9 [bacterium]
MSQVIWTTGRRKTAVAALRAVEGSGRILINNRSIEEYFKNHITQKYEVMRPINIAGDVLKKYDIFIKAVGGGITGQADAIKLAISRFIVEVASSFRPILKREGLLKRDARVVERKKYGRPKARKKFQYSKR